MRISVIGGLTLAWLLPVHDVRAVDSDEPVLLPTVEVVAPAKADDGSVLKIDGPPEEIPITVDTVDTADFERNGGKRVQDLASMVPGVAGATFNPETSGEALMIRGFLSEAVAVNGVRRFSVDGFASYDFANIERFEVLKGSGGVEMGTMDPGGALNLVTKKPLANAAYELESSTASYDNYSLTADATSPLGHGWSYRLIGSAERNGHYRPYVASHRALLAPSLQYEYAPGSRVLVEYSYSDEDLPPDPGVFYVRNAGLPHDFADRRFMNSMPGGFRTGTNSRGAVYWTQRLVPGTDVHLSLEQQRRAGHLGYFSPFMYDFYQGGVDNSLDYAGNSQTYLGYVERTSCACNNRTAQFDISSHWNVLGTRQQTLAGVFLQRDVQRTDLEANQRSRPLDVFNPVYTTDDSNDFTRPADDPNSLSAVFRTHTHQDGYYLVQKADAGRWHFLAGARIEQLRYSGDSTDNQHLMAPSPYTVGYHEPSWRVGSVYDLTPQTFLHVAYADAYLPNFAFDINGHPLPPKESRGSEAGLRQRVRSLGAEMALTVYQVDQRKIAVPDPNDPTFRAAILRGEQRSRGAEFTLDVHPDGPWEMSAQASYTDSRIVEDNRGLQGKVPRNVPYVSGALRSGLQLPGFLRASDWIEAEYVAMGPRPGDDRNRFKLPGYGLVNLQWRAKFQSSVELDLRIDNLLDKTYYDYAGIAPWYVSPGEPRRLTLMLRWRTGAPAAISRS